MKDYLLLFRGSLDSADVSPEQMQKSMMKWKNWMDGLAVENRVNVGQRLTVTRATISGTVKRVVDGPYIEGKEIVGGYMMSKADTLEEAVELAKGCPIFESGGSTEVIEIAAS